jgi:arylsulfatase A-like enzyme
VRALLPFALLVGCSAPSPAPESPPNFVVVIADDLGEDDLGCSGHPTLRTPNVDRLAAEGMRFDRMFLTISSCSPSRASILTGRYPHNTGAEDLHQPLPAAQKTVARYLRPRYHCVSVGKWHLGAAEKTNWDRVVECGSDLAEKAVAELRARPPGKPFFAWIASWDPHRPYDELPPSFDPAKVVVPPYLPDHPDIRKELAKYYDEISRLDRHVGEIRAELERQGELDRTVIVFMSDNGMPFPRAKTTLYDSGIRTPFIVRGPGVAAGAVSKALASSIDLAPTILERAGVEQDSMQGRPLPLRPGAAGRTAVFAEANWHDYDQFTRAVRTERYLLVRNHYKERPLWNSVDSIHSPTWRALLALRREGKLTPGQAYLFQEPRPFEELYDLSSDPFSLRNVAADPAHSRGLADLRILLDHWRVDTEDAMPREPTPDGWSREGVPLPHNQPWYDRWKRLGPAAFEKF